METKTDRMIGYIQKATLRINRDHAEGKITEDEAVEIYETLEDIRNALRELESIKMFMAGHIDLK